MLESYGNKLKYFIFFNTVVIVTTIITYSGIHSSQEYGRLAIPPAYDDVVYFLSAARWIAEFSSKPFVESLAALLSTHAPYSTISAIVGFAITPDNYTGHYAINAAPVGVFLFGVAWLVRRSRLTEIICCIIGAGSIPLMTASINEARPDLTWGLGLSLAIGSIVSRPLLDRSLRSVAVLGLLSGLAILVKPTAAPASLIFLVITVFVADAAIWFNKDHNAKINDVLLRHLIFGLAIAFATAPYLWFSLSRISIYIWNTLVENKDLWSYRGTFGDHIKFYIVNGRLYAFGFWLYVGAILFVLRFILGFQFDRKDLFRAIALLIAVTATYAVPNVTSVKSFFLGAAFYGSFVVAMALNYAAIISMLDNALRGIRPIAQHAVQAVRLIITTALVIIFAHALLIERPILATTFNTETIAAIRSSTEHVIGVLQNKIQLKERDGGSPMRIAASSPYPVTPATLELLMRRASLPVEVTGVFFTPRIEEAIDQLLDADLTIVTSSIPHNLPGPKMGDELMQVLDSRVDVCVVDSLPLPNSGTLKLYQPREFGCSPFQE